MERKTKINAEEGRQEILVTREFDLPVELLFRAHAEPELFEQWMSHEYGTTKVLKYEGRNHGSWQFATSDAQGNTVFGASGVIHAFDPDRQIIRTFEMENSGFDVQIEFLDFKELTADTSRLDMQIIYRSVAIRDQMLKLPFAFGLNMAHDRLQHMVAKLK